MNTFGVRIRKLRNMQGITQKQLAEAVGIREATLSRYENSKRETHWEILILIAKALNTNTEYLLGLTDNYLPSQLNPSVESAFEKHQELLLQFERLNEENKIRVMERISTLLDVQKKNKEE